MAPGRTKQASRSLPAQPRKSHRKSRYGCVICKSRHIKCDETRPTCTNCSVVGRHCLYGMDLLSRSTPTDPGQPQAYSPSSCSSASQPVSDDSPPSHGKQVGGKNSRSQIYAHQQSSIFTLDHLSLFHHAQTHGAIFMISNAPENPGTEELIEATLKSSYLMHEFLAIAALHLGMKDPGRSDYHKQATTLRTQALLLFPPAKEGIWNAPFIPVLLFSSLLGLHFLHDIFRNYDTLGGFLDQFIESVHSYRSVVGMINQSSGDNEEFKHDIVIIGTGNSLSFNSKYEAETEALYRMLNESHLPPAARRAYREIVTKLRATFTLYRKLKANGTRPYDALLAFYTTIDDNYIEHLGQRRPEALVIFAFHAVMLHWNQEFWVFNNFGRYLIEAITTYLGDAWENCLEWPNSVLEMSDSEV